MIGENLISILTKSKTLVNTDEDALTREGQK